MTHAEIAALADRFFAAIEAGDITTVGEIYHQDAVVWHNYDQVAQRAQENLIVLGWIVGRTTRRSYDEVRRIVLDDGFVQQHVLRADAPGGQLEVPAMMRVWVDGGRITRIDEYLDPRQADVLRA